MTNLKLRTLTTVVGAAMAALLAGPVAAQGAATAQAAVAPQAAHAHDAAAPHKLALDHDGRRWATDEPLRAGMDRIRGLVAPKLASAHAGKLAGAQYGKLAAQVEAEVGSIVANCKLEPQADAMLHIVVGELVEGADAMAGKNPKLRREAGLAKVAIALNEYGRYFDHPGFKPIPVKH